MAWRSVLFTPGNRTDRVRKALDAGAADLVVADLEDAVAPDDKAAARTAVATLLATPDIDRDRLAVRVNPWPSALAEQDLDEIMDAAPRFLVIPKAEDAATIEALDARLSEAEAAAGHEPGSTGLLLILETALGVVKAFDVATASPRVRAVAFGAEDLAADARMRRSPGNHEVAFARAQVALAAAAARVDAIDMITADFRDTERFAREAAEARALGYSGKMCLHPVQVEAAHAAYAPDDEEVAWAQAVIAAADAAGGSGGGVVVVDGRMIDVPLIEQARAILRADAPSS